MGGYLASFLLFSGVGIVFALPVLLPPVRRWLRRGMGRRVTAVIIWSLTILSLTFIAFAWLAAQLQTFFLCNPYTDFANPGCSADDAAKFGFVTPEEMETAITQELFRRAITPPPFRQDCYRDDPAFCEFVQPLASDDGDLLGGILVFWPAIVTGMLVWLWTRPKREQ